MTGDEVAAALDAAAGSVPAAAGRVRRTGRVFGCFAEAYEQQTVAVDGGHLHWTGATGGHGTPVIAVGGQVETAYRVAFRQQHGREPVGNVRPTCSYPCCVAGGHLADRAMRAGDGG